MQRLESRIAVDQGGIEFTAFKGHPNGVQSAVRIAQ
jgi:hypothetical protein